MTGQPTTPEPVTEAELDRATDPEYAAVSTGAVIGLLLGLAGFSSVLAVPFVAVPVLGLILCVAALRKIRRSRGVLTGRRLAIAGIVLGAAAAALGAGRHASLWLGERRMLGHLQAQALEIADDLLADRYDKVFERLPEDFRARDKGPEAFRKRFLPLLDGAGPLVRRDLLTLQVITNEKGETLAPAEVRVELEKRIVEVDLWFRLADDGRWELVGVGGEETFESVTRFGPQKPVPPVSAPPPQP
jgi:hypothetical protein